MNPKLAMKFSSIEDFVSELPDQKSDSVSEGYRNELYEASLLDMPNTSIAPGEEIPALTNDSHFTW